MSKKKEDPQKDPDWYYRNRKTLGERAAATIRAGKATVMTEEKVAARLAASKETKSVTIRLAERDIQMAKEQADRLGLPYQTYLKSVLHQALESAR
jgi:predicted DNA binding CopG/RHH family protein